MVELINRRLEKEHTRERQKGLSDILDKTLLRKSYPIPSDKDHYLLSTIAPTLDVLEIIDGTGVVTIDVKENAYLDTAKRLGNLIEKDYAKKYGKRVRIRYTD
jgi:hypothetical protein